MVFCVDKLFDNQNISSNFAILLTANQELKGIDKINY